MRNDPLTTHERQLVYEKALQQLRAERAAAEAQAPLLRALARAA